jgi:hypothetical protein
MVCMVASLLMGASLNASAGHDHHPEVGTMGECVLRIPLVSPKRGRSGIL